jgi:iron(III) transport system ATP-binding protein
MSVPFLTVVEVSKRFAHEKIIDGVSLEISEGEVVALLGPSGCGKTTLLRLIAGLETPDEGEIWIAGERVSTRGRNIVPPPDRNVGFVFQDLALWPHLTVAGNLEFVLRSRGWEKHARRSRIEEVLRLVRIEPLAQRYPSQLSGGEQQRTAIARALVARSQLLLLDEPLSNLDSDLKVTLLQELSVLQQKLKVTTLYVTHDRAEAATLAHRIALMKRGRIDNIVTPETVRTNSDSTTDDLSQAIR